MSTEKVMMRSDAIDTSENREAVDEREADGYDDSDASTEIEVAEEMRDVLLNDELELGVFERHLPRPIFWDNFLESSLVKMAFLMGMDTIGSFTNLYMKYGEMVFFPLLTMLFLLGFPIMFLELTLGQYTSLNPASLYKRMVPAFGGMGMTIVFLNFILVGAQVQQAALYTGLFFESIARGSSHKLYELCNMDYNNQICMTDMGDCPQDEPLLLDSQCTSNTSYKFNSALESREKVYMHVPFIFPLYQFLFRSILGETDFMMVVPGHTSAIVTYTAIWLFLYVLKIKGGSKLVKWMALVTAFIFFAQFLTITIVWCFLERPFWYNATQLAMIDSGNRNTTLYQPAGLMMWVDVGVHIMTNLGIGDGAIITLAANQKFSSCLLLDALLIIVCWICVPYAHASFNMDNVVRKIYETMRTSPSYQAGEGIFMKAYEQFLHRRSYHANMLTSAISMASFKGYDDQMLAVFAVTGFFLIMTSVIIRFEIISSCLSEQIVGLPKIASDCRLRATVLFGLLVLLFTVHRHGLHYLEIFYQYSLIGVTCVIIIMEVIACYIYSPQRIYAAVNATHLSWNWLNRSRRRHQCLEIIVIGIIASWVLVPPILFLLVIGCFRKPYTLADDRGMHHRLFGFGIIAFLLSPIVYTFVKRMFIMWKGKTKMILEFKPVQRLWGPHHAKNRALSQRVEAEYQATF